MLVILFVRVLGGIKCNRDEDGTGLSAEQKTHILLGKIYRYPILSAGEKKMENPNSSVLHIAITFFYSIYGLFFFT